MLSDGSPTLGAPEHDEVTERLLEVIAKEGMVPREKLVFTATLEDLNIASIDLVTILMGIEEEFDVYLPVEGKLVEARNVGDLVQALKDVIAAKAADAQETPPNSRAGQAHG